MNNHNNRLQSTLISLTGMIVICAGILSCSSAPKKPAEIFTMRNAAQGHLELANISVSKNDYTTAHTYIAEAWRLAVSCDDPNLRIRVLLCKGNALFNEGELDKARAEWKLSLYESTIEKNTAMIAASKVHLARVTLAEGKAAEAKTVATQAISQLKTEPLFIAQAWRVIGLAEKELGNSKEAENAFLQSEKIHTKDNYLEESAYDWYLIASSRSKSGQYASSIEALNTALDFDRRCENAYAIGMDWQAIGLVQEKAGNKEEAKSAYSRSAAVFTAAGFLENAEKASDKVH